MKKSLLLYILLPFLAQAQDLTTEVVVDRSVAVDLPSASPLSSVVPSFILQSAHTHGLHTSDYTMTADYTPTVNIGDLATYTGIPTGDGYRGFAWLGYFPAYNLGAGVGYKVLDNKSNRLNLAADFDGAAWKAKDIDENKLSQHYNTFDINADYSHIFKNQAIFKAHADYGHDAVGVPYSYPEKGSFDYNRGNYYLSIARDGDIRYSARVFYNFFNVDRDYKPGSTTGMYIPSSAIVTQPKENMFGFEGSIGAVLKGKSAIDFGIKILRQNFKIDYPDPSDTRNTDHNSWLIGLNPTFRFSVKAFDFKLGIHVDLDHTGDGFGFYGAPDLGFVWHVTKWAQVYAEADGGCYYNTLGNVYNYSVFAPESPVYGIMPLRIDAKVGVRSASFAGLSAEVFGAYASASDVAMPSVSIIFNDLQTRGFGSQDVSGWYAGVGLKYSYNDLVSAHIDARFYQRKGYWQNLDNARTTLNADVDVKASDCLTIGASYRLRSNRYVNYDMFVYDKYINSVFDLGSVSDFGLHASYRLNRQLSFFARIDNLFCHRYQILPGIQSQSIHGLVGAAYKF